MSTKRISLAEILLWIMVLLLVVIAVSPIALGFKIKNDYTAMIQKMSDMMQANVQVVSYERGFFSSDVILETRIPNYPLTLQFKEEVIHGPLYLGLLNQGKSPLVAAVVKGKMLTPASAEAVFNKLFPGSSALIYQNIIDFSANVQSQAYVPAINAVFELESGPMNIQSNGLVMNTLYSAAEASISGEGQVSQFIVTTSDENMNNRGLRFSYSGKMGQNDMLIGDSVISLRKLEFQSPEDQFAVNNLTLRSVSSEQGVLINSELMLNAREILLDNSRFGPIAFNLTMNGLNAQAIRNIQSLQEEMDSNLKSGLPPEQVNAMMMGQMMTLLPDLFNQAEIRIDPLSIESELGGMQAQMEFSISGLDANSPADPMFLFNAINLDVAVDVDKPLMLKMVEWQLNAAEAQQAVAGSSQSRRAESNVPMDQKVNENLRGLLSENWLVFEDGIYSSQISLHNGEMVMNNQSVDVMSQLMSQMAPPPGN